MANKMNQKNQRKLRKQRGRGRLGTNMTNVGANGPFAPTLTKWLNYADVVTLTEAAAGAGQYQLYRTADVFDPDYTGVGHQPMYFDSLCSSTGPYFNFTVPEASFELRFTNVSAYPVLVTVVPTCYATIPASRTIASERPLCWKRLLPPVGTGGAMVETKIKVDNSKLVGLPKTIFESSFMGDYSTSAPFAAGMRPPFLQVIIWGIGGIGSVVTQVNARYKTKFFQLAPAPQS